MSDLNMLEHQKLILQNLTHDNALFKKELIKSLKWLSEPDAKKLHEWLISNFGSTHKGLITTIFDKEAA